MGSQQEDRKRLAALIKARHPCISIVTREEGLALSLARDAAALLEQPIHVWSIIGGLRAEGLFANTPPIPETEHPAAALYYFAQRLDQPGVCVTLDLASHLSDARTLRLLRNVLIRFPAVNSQLVMIDHRDDLPAVISAEATRFDLSLPDDGDIENTVRDTLRVLRRRGTVKISIKQRTWSTLLRNLRGLTRRQIEQIIADVVVDDQRLDDSDLNAVLAQKRQLIQRGGLLEYIETPVNLAEIGGLRRLKRWLKQREQSTSDEAVALGLTAPRGVLMLGVQGAGKSLCAKAIATAWQRPLLRLDPGALYDRYVGESERRLRDALYQAERMAPIVLWVDEIEKAFASAASRSTDGGLSQRMFGTLLTWMQEHVEPVFLVATANDIEALPPELLRKGRFDEIFFVDLPDKLVRRQIFAIHLSKRGHDPHGFDLQLLAESSAGFSGAEIEQAIIAALHEVLAGGGSLNTELLLATIKASPPLSVTMAERVDELRAWAQGRCVRAD